MQSLSQNGPDVGAPSAPRSARHPSLPGPQAERCRLATILVATDSGAALPALNAPGRGRRAIHSARAGAMYLAHVGAGVPMAAVGRFFGRHHSTVAHACRLIEERRETPDIDARFDLLEQELRRALGEMPHGC